MAKFSMIQKEGKLNSDYGKEFEAWLGDRFLGRDQLIDARFQMLYKINGRIENDKAFIGDDGWMFNKNRIFQTFAIRKQMIDRVVRDVKSLNEKVQDSSTLIYLVLVPLKEKLLEEKWHNYYQFKRQASYEEEIIKSLGKEKNIRIIYPYQELLDSNVSGDVYQRAGEHLTGKGEEVVARSIFDQLTKDFPDFRDINITSWGRTQKYSDKNRWLLPGYEIEREVKYNLLEYGNGGYIKQDEKIGALEKESEKFYEKGHSEKYLSDFSFYSIGVCNSSFIYKKFNSLFRDSTFIRSWTALSSAADKKQMENHLYDMLLDINTTSKAVIVLALVIDGYYLDKHLYPLENVLKKYENKI